jgi:hypothetical protein
MDDYNEVRNQQPENNEENEQFTDQMLLAISKKYEGWNRDEHGQEHDDKQVYGAGRNGNLRLVARLGCEGGESHHDRQQVPTDESN